MAAAEHGANFPMAKKVRKSLSKDQMRDFAKTKEKGLPEHTKKKHKMDPKPMMAEKKKAKARVGRKHATDPKEM